MTSDMVDVIRNQAIHSRQYLDNALSALQQGEAGKAGELLWGSVALAIQAVATSRNLNIDTHRKLRNFVLQLAIDLNDEAMRTDFLVAESLHYNFYVIEREPQDITILVPNIERLVDRLFSLIAPELLEQQPTS